MPLLEEIFDALSQAKVFSTLDLKAGYHQLPLKEGVKVKMTFWGINLHLKDCLHQWRFLPFSLKNAPTKCQRVWIECWQDLVLPSATLITLSFSSRHQRIMGIICKRYSKDLRFITLSFTQASAEFSKHKWNTWVT